MEGSLPVHDPVGNYEKIKRIGEGTYGVVCKCSSQFIAHCTCVESVKSLTLLVVSADKARDRTTGEIVALKKVRMERERDGSIHAPESLYLCEG